MKEEAARLEIIKRAADNCMATAHAMHDQAVAGAPAGASSSMDTSDDTAAGAEMVANTANIAAGAASPVTGTHRGFEPHGVVTSSRNRTSGRGVGEAVRWIVK